MTIYPDEIPVYIAALLAVVVLGWPEVRRAVGAWLHYINEWCRRM